MATLPVSLGNSFDLPNMSFANTSVLVRAINAEDVSQVKFLLECGSDPNKAVGNKKMSPLMVAAHIEKKSKRLAIFKSLFQYGIDLELKDSYGQNGLMYTCAKDLKEELKFILDHFDCNFYNTDVHGNTLLHVCAKYSSPEVLEIVMQKMLQINMDINILNKGDHTALDEALRSDNSPCIEYLKMEGVLCKLPLSKKKVIVPQEQVSGIRDTPVRPRHSLPTISSLRKAREISTKEETALPDLCLSATEIARPRTTPLRDPDEILYRLLDLKTPEYCMPSDIQVSLDDESIPASPDQMTSLLESQEWVSQNASSMPEEISDSLTIQDVQTLQVKSSKHLWKRVFKAVTNHKKKRKKKKKKSEAPEEQWTNQYKEEEEEQTDDST